MTAPGENTLASRPSKLKRYGPVVAVVVVVAVVAAVAAVAGRDTRGGSSGPVKTLRSATVADVPITYNEAKEQGKLANFRWSENCDPNTGRLEIPSLYSPPCLPEIEGDNGGSTYEGVTGDEITIVNFVPPQNGDVTAMFTAQMDDPEAMQATAKAFATMLDDLYSTYGRRLNIVRFDGSGAPGDAIAAHADAVTVIDRFKPFASLGGPMLTPAYATELARNGVLCLGCGMALPDQFLQDHAPYVWAGLPTPEQFLQNLGDYITQRVNNRKASFAGSPELREKQRVFGVVHMEQDPPVFKEVAQVVEKCGGERGWHAEVSETYLFELGKMPERAPTIIAKMKEAGVTTIIFLGDPIMPVYLTEAAESQDYHPEWIISGTPLVDTTVLGRFYNQNQWKHAFGLSNLGVSTKLELQEPYRLHKWYYGVPPAATKTSALIYAGMIQLYMAIHMAGPNLTPETFKAGLFHYPGSGGTIASPHMSFGDHGYFKLTDRETCQFSGPRLDFTGTDDMVEIWWDADATTPDEQGKTDKTGAWRFANNGKRYLPGTMPSTDADAFNLDGSISMIDAVPPGEEPPEYPSPNKPLPT